MGTWPDPNTGNKTIGIVGPLVDDGGVVSDLKALGLPTTSTSAVYGKSYYFPFQVYEYWTPFYIAASHTTATGGVSPNFFTCSIQFAIYSEIGTTSAKQVATTSIWETRGQANTFNVHTLSPQSVLPPGGYYAAFQVTPTTNGLTFNTGTFTSASAAPIVGCRESASAFQSVVTDLSATAFGILADLHIRAMFL